MKISPARTAAFDSLLQIGKGALSAVVLAEAEKGLAPIDRGLCHAITLGVLRRKLYLDTLIDALTKGKKLDREVRVAIQMGLYQVLYLDRVPQHSAVDESVKLVRRAKKTSAQGLVNAVLRGAIRGLPTLDVKDGTESIAIETSHPSWLIRRWEVEFGRDKAVELARFNNEFPRIAFRVIERNEKVDALMDRSRPSAVVGGCFIPSAEADVNELSKAGLIYLQDEASQMAAGSVSPPSGGSVIDVCAAPGGKTAIIACNAPRGTLVIAGDLNTNRVKLLRDNLRRQHVLERVAVVQYDAADALPFEDGAFDVVYVDAPCSGTGTIRSNPEIRYRVDEQCFDRFASKQRAILKNASKLVRPGGELIYTTCSLERDENEEICDDLLTEDPGFHKRELSLPQRFLTLDGYGRTWPPRDGMDGFFIARLGRRE